MKNALSRPARALAAGLFFLILGAAHASAESEPLLLLADLEYAGISELQMKLAVDLISYMIFENGTYVVMNRYERNKLLRGFGYNQKNLKERRVYLEAAELLHARYIVTGSLLGTASGLELTLAMWDVGSGQLVKSDSSTAPDFKALIDGTRSFIERFIGKPAAVRAVRPESSGLTASLYVTRIRERLLLALPAGPLDEAAAAARLLAGEASSLLAQDERLSLLFTSIAYSVDQPAPASFAPTLAARDCHTLALIAREGEALFLCVYQPDFTVKMKLPLPKLPLPPRADRAKEAELVAKKIREAFPPFAPSLIARELEREIIIKEKLDRLLFNEKLLSQDFMVNLHLSAVKPAVVGIYHPLLNILSLELDGYWYYADVIGIGAGYAVALGYPAVIDSKLSAHPLVLQHEFRLIPLSFRSVGQVGVIFNLIAAFNMHNAYEITSPDGVTYSYSNEMMLMFIKAALNMGIVFNITDDVSMFLDLATPSFIFPLNQATVSVSGSNFSGGFGGLGVIVRF